LTHLVAVLFGLLAAVNSFGFGFSGQEQGFALRFDKFTNDKRINI